MTDVPRTQGPRPTAKTNSAVPARADAGSRPFGGVPVRPPGAGLPTDTRGALKGLGTLTGALRRRRWSLLVGALIGVCLAVAAFVVFPPAHEATTSMILGQSGQVDPRAMENDAALLRTKTVARRAIAEAGLQVSASELLSSVRVDILSTRILRLTAEGPTGAEAVHRAKAMAEAFLAFRAEEMQRQADVTVGILADRSKSISTDLATVNDQILGFSGTNEPRTDAAVRQLGDLLTQRSVLSDRLRQLREQAESISLEPKTIAEKSRVLDGADDKPLAAAKALAVNVVAGTVGGVGVAACLVVLGAFTSDRVRRRSELTAASGAPVTIGIAPVRGSVRSHRRQFRRHQHRDEPAIAPAVRQLQRSFLRGGTNRTGFVLSHEADLAAAISLAEVAIKLADGESHVLLADLSASATLARLFDAGPGDAVKVYPSDDGEEGGVWLARPGPDGDVRVVLGDVRQKIDVLLALGSADSSSDDLRLDWAKNAVIFVQAGSSRAVTLRGVTQALAEAGVHVDAAVLVGADANDRTVSAYDLLGGERYDAAPAVRTDP